MKKYIMISLVLIVLMICVCILPAGPSYPPQKVDLESVSGNTDLILARQRGDAGSSVVGKAVTATLRVSPNGDDSDGLSWSTAYNAIETALDAASTDENDCTLILVGPHAANYDIDTTGDPTWAANVILKGTYRNWTTIKNTHVSATSIMKLTGKSAVEDLNFNLGTGGNGLIMTRGGCRIHRAQFVGVNLTGVATALWLDGASVRHAKAIDIDFLGNATYMTALKVDQFGHSNFEQLRIHYCLVGIQVLGANSDDNQFLDVDIGECALALDLDAGNEQHFTNLTLHLNTTDVDDEVGDHIWTNIFGSFLIKIEPDNLVGVTVNTGAANTYGSDTEIRAVATSTCPFRIVGIHLEPSTSEWYQVRFSADSGSTFYDIVQFDATKREGVAAPSGTEFIFNKGTRISASARDVSGGDNVKVWIEIQEI